MPLPQPEDWADRIRALEREVKDLKSSITNQGGVTTASAGLIFPSQAVPSSPASGGHLHAEGNDPYWTAANGSTRAIIQVIPQGTGVSNPPSMSAGPAPASYNVLHSQSLRDDIADTRVVLLALLSSLRGANIIA